jgi:hypothetical protein
MDLASRQKGSVNDPPQADGSKPKDVVQGYVSCAQLGTVLNSLGLKLSGQEIELLATGMILSVRVYIRTYVRHIWLWPH